MSKRSHHEFSGPGGEDDDEQNLLVCRSKRNRILPPRKTKSIQVFAKVPPGTNGHVLVDFLNYTMKKEGMIEHERDGIIRFQSLLKNDQCWCLEMPSETLAEELCYLNGVSFQEEPDVFITLCRHSSYSNIKPRFTGWNSYYRFKYNRNSPQIECCVFACISEGTDTNELRELLNDKMKDHFYAFISEEEHGPILACNRFPKSDRKKFMVYLSTPELAEKLLWLDGIHVKDSKIHLARHKDYRGPPPKYPSFESFRHSGEYKIQIEVFVNQKPSKNTREELFDFLTDQLHHYRLVSERERLIVDLLDISKAENTWKVFAANPKIACILAYFDYVPWNGTVLRINRDRDYHGPPPRYRNFHDLLNSDSRPPQKLSEAPETWDVVPHQRSSKEHPETRAFLHAIPNSTTTPEVIEFLNATMISEGFTDEKAIVKFWQAPGRKDLVALEMASGKLAENVNYLCGIKVPGKPGHIKVSRSKHHPKPKYASWVQYKTDSDPAALRIELLHPLLDELHQIKNFLDQKLKYYRLVEGEECSVFKCWRRSSRSVILEMCSPDLADKIMYLQGMEWKDGTVILKRHFRYKGPPPRYSSFQEFQAAMTGSSDKETGKTIDISDTHLQACMPVSSEKKDGKTNNTSETSESEATAPSTSVDKSGKTDNATNAPDGEQRSLPSSVVDPAILQKQRVVDLPRPAKITPEKALQPQKEKQIVLSDTATLVRANAETFVRRVSQNIEQDIGIEKERGSKRTEPLSKSSGPCSTNDDELMELRDRVSDVSNELETTQNKLTEVTGELSTAKSCLRVVTGQYEAYRNQVDEKTAELAVAKSHLNDNVRQNETTQKQLTEITGELATTKKERDDLQCRLMNVTGQFESTRKQWIDVTGELATTKKQRDDFQSRLKDVTSQLETAQTRLAEGTGELATAKKQRDDIHDSWQHQAVELIDKQEEIDKLKRNLEEMSKNLNTLVDSMTLQNSELIRERNVRRELEDALRASRSRAGFTQNTPFHPKKEEAKNPE